ncbi:putative Phospholipid-transporting ATPase IA [Giardia muris]|uniref:Phospholipid-transporting ATPase n=1 Tax=Giardia muris TaxID=5742 RepID=A0A4Z1T359_GIAMU|nr:putative Phospholipid-transporting ATPase IA [Giardia muris]|eukprot:TNJ28383.1 putative Phospholipid-transporting ATPase IA [Giardia muris]
MNEFVISFSGDSVTAPLSKLNVIKTRKYTWWSFFFIAILRQFTYFSNQFFLVITILQLFPSFQVGLAFTYYLPLIFIVCVSVLRELFDEINRGKRDKAANSVKYHVLNAREFVLKRSSDIQVGDLILLNPGQRVPADIIPIHSTGQLYIRTDNIDGETDLKARSAMLGHHPLDGPDYPSELRTLLDGSLLTYEPPSKNLYAFLGKFESKIHPSRASIQAFESRSVTIPLSITNTIWGNCSLSRGSCLGVVIYTGRDSRSSIRPQKLKPKTGRTDIEINLYVKMMFIVTLLLAFLCTIASTNGTVVTYVRWCIMMSNIIPFSLKVSQDFGKFFMAGSISNDPDIKGISVRSTDLSEQLGRISHVFSDKTGTITKNEMSLHEIVVSLGTEMNSDAKETVLYGLLTCHSVEPHVDEPVEQIQEGRVSVLRRGERQKRQSVSTQNLKEQKRQVEKFEPPTHLGAALYTVPTGEGTEGRHTQPRCIGASPDEVAIVSYFCQYGYFIRERTSELICLTTPTGTETFRILHIFPFSSETKRMSVIVQHERTQEVYLYVKGADSVISKISESCGWMQPTVDSLAMMGRRTLVYSYKKLSGAQRQRFQDDLEAAYLDIKERDLRLAELEEMLVKDLEVICVTGIEDQLQDNAEETIVALKRAGINFWLLTGDKVTTCICIAQSCGLLPTNAIMQHAAREGATSTVMSTSASVQFITPTDTSLGIPIENIHMNLSVDMGLDLRLATGLDTSPALKGSAKGRLSKRQDPTFFRPRRLYGTNLYFLTEDMSYDALIRQLYELDKLKDQGSSIALIVDGVSLEQLIGNHPADYFYDYDLHPLTNTLERLNICVRLWRRFVRFVYLYFTGRPRTGKGSLNGKGGDLRELFASATCNIETVLCCRCTPFQKALISELISTYTGRESLGIGDGANDVLLLQSCSVGIGILGKEGRQAAAASEYAIEEFQGLRKLLFWHGRNSYTGCALMCQFLMQRGIAISLIQIWFSLTYYLVTLVLYTGVLMLGYATFFTMFPPFNYFINEEIDYKLIMAYPEVYRYTAKGRLMNLKTFAVWLIAGVVISFLIFLMATSFLPGNVQFDVLVLITFNALLLNQLLIILYMTHRWSVLLILFVLGSYLSFYLVLTIYPDVYSRAYLYSWDFTWRSVSTAACATLPVYLGYQVIRHAIPPPIIRKLRKMREPGRCRCKCDAPGCRTTCVHTRSSTGMYYFNMPEHVIRKMLCNRKSKTATPPSRPSPSGSKALFDAS